MCALLPPRAFKKDDLVAYEGKSFQHAPKWPVVAAYALVIEHMLDTVSSPVAPAQLSIESGMAAWLENQELEYSKSQIEKATYRFRMVYSQVVNHHRKQRSIPRAHRARFAKVWRLCDAMRDMMADIVADGHAVNMIGDIADVEERMVISDSDEELLDNDALFGDVVFALVADDPCPRPTMRLWGKRSCFDLTAPSNNQINEVMYGYVVL